MGTDTKIEWANHTANAWIGCSKVSPACDFCYAERGAKRLGVEWGDEASRYLTKWLPLALQVRRWDEAAKLAGERHRVFWNSYSDFLEDQQELKGRRMLACALMEQTTHLIHLILTKRPENAEALLPKAWMTGAWPQNVWFGTTAENQEYADLRIPRALRVPAPIHFVSYEPALGPVDFRLGHLFSGRLDRHCETCGRADRDPVHKMIDWLIVGGESGPKARPFDLAWARSAIEQCKAAGVLVFMKQIGSRPTGDASDFPQHKGQWTPDGDIMYPKLTHPKGGDPNEWPEEIRVREVPRLEA